MTTIPGDWYVTDCPDCGPLYLTMEPIVATVTCESCRIPRPTRSVPAPTPEEFQAARVAAGSKPSCKADYLIDEARAA